MSFRAPVQNKDYDGCDRVEPMFDQHDREALKDRYFAVLNTICTINSVE